MLPAPAPPSAPLLHLLVVHAYNNSEISFKTSSHGVAPDSLSQWLPHCKKGHIPFAGSSVPDVPAIRAPITSPAPNSLLPHLDFWLYRCQGYPAVNPSQWLLLSSVLFPHPHFCHQRRCSQPLRWCHLLMLLLCSLSAPNRDMTYDPARGFPLWEKLH